MSTIAPTPPTPPTPPTAAAPPASASTAGQWLSTSDAASRLGVSSRTLARWIAAEKVRTRMSVTGRRLVWIDDDAGAGGDRAGSLAEAGNRVPFETAIEAVREQSADTVRLAGVSIQATERTSKALAGQIELSLDSLDRAMGEIRSQRRLARLAWGVVAVLVLAGAAGLWWGTSTVTRQDARLEAATAELERMAGRMASLTATVTATETAAERERARATDALRRFAVASAELDAQRTWAEILRCERAALMEDALAVRIDPGHPRP